MSFLDSLRDSLASTGSLQLLLAFAALLAYSLALAAGVPTAVRAAAAGMALIAATGFAFVTPRWPDGVALMSMAVVACGAFAGCTWLLSRILGVADTRGRLGSQTLASRRRTNAPGAAVLDAAVLDAAFARAKRLSRRAAVHPS